MSFRYKYFNRDLSWLSFNHRVLEEAKDTTLPLYEQMTFLAIYSSNLDDFYRVRVAAYRNSAESDTSLEDVTNPAMVLSRINHTVSGQIKEMSEILKTQIAPRLLKHKVKLYLDEMPTDEKQLKFIKDYFFHEVIAYLQPVLLTKGTRTFLRDNRPYLALKMFAKNIRCKDRSKQHPTYALVKLPLKDPPYFNDLARFVELPSEGKMRYIMFLDDVIRINLNELFPGYDIVGEWSIKVSRDADLGIDELGDERLVEMIKQNIARRSTGLPSSFYHDRNIAHDLLKYLKNTFGFTDGEMVESGRYLNLHHLTQFPKELIKSETLKPIEQIKTKRLLNMKSMFDEMSKGDIVVHYPYQPFDYVIRLLNEAIVDPTVEEIKVTQYRVANNSAVVASLISAAKSGKKVTVFVELKARFDEMNNLEMSERMKEAGINIIYSIPGLKVHAKMMLIVKKEQGKSKGYAYLSTGNFNENTAKQYTDHGLFTCDTTTTDELKQVFSFLENRHKKPQLKKLLVTQINLKEKLTQLIDDEIKIAQEGGEARMILKMNGLQHRHLINKLYEASLAGVKIDLIVRGICCLVPDQAYSKNIRIIRIVDRFLEHGRVWLFRSRGENKMYLTSSDWLNRNMQRRIELAFPIDDQDIKQEIMDILDIQLNDNVKAREINANLDGLKPVISDGSMVVRAQENTYKMLLNKNR
ncbi:MAG: polyphosphate kinase 1 [Bacteroidales bacterium]|nr:polyphosphate kinase 1 [Bacteroidales bacterium]